MGKKGPSRHLKRHDSPAHWPIHRKTKVWSIKPKPGPHSLETGIPATVLLREELGYAETAKEAKIILSQNKFWVDGKPRRDKGYTVGLMDVVQIPDTQEYFRVLPAGKGRLKLTPITPEEAQMKLCKVEGKKTLKGGRTQLNLHDGSNIILEPEEDHFKVNDVVSLKLPERELLGHYEFKEMKPAIVIGGRSQGARGTLIHIGDEPGEKKTATLRTSQGEDIRTLASYIFVVGDNEPVISLGEEEGV